jgi:hypothetical protein
MPHEGSKFQAFLTSTEDTVTGHFQESGNVTGSRIVTEYYVK